MIRLDFVDRRAQPNAGELGGQRFSVTEWQFPFFGAMGQGSKAADKSRIELPGHLLPRACQSANHNGRIFSYFSQQPAPCALRFGVHFFPPLRAVPAILTPAALVIKPESQESARLPKLVQGRCFSVSTPTSSPAKQNGDTQCNWPLRMPGSNFEFELQRFQITPNRNNVAPVLSGLLPLL